MTLTRQLDVLPGDFSDDGRSTCGSIGVRNEILGIDGAVPTIFGDINGEGVVTFADYIDVVERLGTRLPPVGKASIAVGTIDRMVRDWCESVPAI